MPGNNLTETCVVSSPPGVFGKWVISLSIIGVIFMVAFFIERPVAEGAELQELLDERTTVVWIEGQQLGDMIIGSRAQVAFIFVDGKLMRAAGTSPEAPQWLTWNVQHFSEANDRGKALFIIRFKTFKPWDFDISLFLIGEYVPKEEDVITRKAFRPRNNIPSDTSGTFALMVPREIIGRGKKLEVGCSGFSAVLKVPR